MNWLILQSAALLTGFVIDCILGDPYSIPHPVCLIGKLISALDKRLRRGNSNPDDISRGVALTVITVSVSTLVPLIITAAAWIIHPVLYFIVESVMCWQIIAPRQLWRESRKVQKALEKGDVEGARYAVSMIVGRDTDVLDEDGITRAAVETVAENTSDGVIAPLIYIFIGGAVGGFFYKSVNTLDSMVGYKNDKYLYFGRASAKLDDVLNYIPARLSAVFMILSCPFLSADMKGAWRIFRRDRFKHASPNSAQTESACAGALGLRLAGDAIYGGVLHKKEYIGDMTREIEPADITRAGRLMYGTTVITLLLILLVRLIILCL